jgi:hypothetical protein
MVDASKSLTTHPTVLEMLIHVITVTWCLSLLPLTACVLVGIRHCLSPLSESIDSKPGSANQMPET